MYISSKLRGPMSTATAKKYHDEILRMFEILPEVSRDFGVKTPTIDFTFTGKRNGHYTFNTQNISISPKPWNGSPLYLFIHEFAHHIQCLSGRTTPTYLNLNRGHTLDGAHGWSFYEILKVVVDHFEFTYEIIYDWATEYDHIRCFHQIMVQPPDYIPPTQIIATASLFGCSHIEARRIILQQKYKSDPANIYAVTGENE